MKTLIKNVRALLPDGTTPLTNIMIDRDKIAAIGEVPEDFRPAKVIDGKVCEPIERMVADVPESSMGSVIEKMGRRKGDLLFPHITWLLSRCAPCRWP